MTDFKKYMKKYGIKLLLVVIIISITATIVIVQKNGKASGIKDASESMGVPVQSASTGAVAWLEGIYSYMFGYDKLKEENENLKVQIGEMELELREAQGFEAEIAELRSLLDLKPKYKSYTFEAANIVDRGSSNWNSTFSIGCGSLNGVEVGDCVIDSAYNVVGQVSEVGETWATVSTIIDTDLRMGALTAESGSAAVIIGELSLMLQGQTKLDYLTEDAQIFEGDVLVTSGMGGKIPSDLKIGTILSLEQEAAGQVQYAIVEPACDLNALTRVFVIKDYEIVE